MPTITGTIGNDTLNGGETDDILNGLDGDDILIGAGGIDLLNGGSGSDTLIGGEGSDQLDGELGADLMQGGAGNDSYFIDNVGDVVDESTGSGRDTVRTIFDFSSALIETVFLMESGDINVSRNTNVSLIGGTDGRIYGNSGDNVLTLGAGSGTIYAGFGDDTLNGGAGGNLLFGESGNDQIFGGDGIDTLDGGIGADFMRGGSGNDTYYIDNVGDVIEEENDAGRDSVYTSISFSTSESIESVRLDGTDNINVSVNSSVALILVGNVGNNVISAGSGDDLLQAEDGNDSLNGGAGADRLNGGNGFDLARYDNATTSIYVRLDGITGASGEAAGDIFESIEGLVGSYFDDIIVGNNLNADYLYGLGGGDALYGLGGSDTLTGGAGNDNLYGGLGGDVLDGGADFDLARYDSATTGIYTRLDGVAGQSGEAVGDTYIGIEGLVGSAFADTFVGNNTGNETLYGLGGNDALYGLGGNDTLFGGAGGDVLNGGAGFDLARYDQAASAVYTRLDGVAGQGGEAIGDTYIGIEGLVGSAFNDTFVGNNVNADYLFGLAGNDGLYGLGGADYLDGSTGNDTLFGGAGADQFVFNTALNATTNVDTIGDFAAGTDDIVLSQAIFTGIGATLDASEFQIGTADSGTDRIIYNQTTGQLFYDSNGNGAGGSTLFATVTTGTALTLADFVMVA